MCYNPCSLPFRRIPDCDATIVHFVNQSQNAPTGVVWNFGDTTTISDVSTEYNPTWDYPAFGSYTVTLMTPPNAVCKDTIQQSILLEQKTLEADFSFGYTGCEEGVVSVQFFDETNNSEDDTNSWLWTFSGVYTGTSTLMNPSIMVSQTGWLYVTLKAMTSENCSDTTALDSLYIDLTELPNLEDDGEVLGCLNGGATLNPGGDTTYTYSWSPSNGLSCTNCPSPNANPSTTSTYTVTVTNLNGADTCIITRMITVVVPSDIHLVGSSDVTTCDPTTTLSATVGMLPVDYAWFDENGTQIAGDVQTVTVPVAGYSYFVVRATDPEGCHYYDTINVVGGPPNIEAIGAQVICSDELLSVSATNLDQNDTLTWQWTPDPIFNGPTNVQNPSVQILTGDRWLYVTATNQFGCSATDSTYVAVVDTANTLDFEYVVSCNGSDVQFVNTSMNAFNYTWNFGDPTSVSDTSHLDNPVYNYPGPGTYLVQLTMDFDLACVDTLEKQVVILSTQFVPDFTYDYVYCETDSIVVQFHDATTIQQPGIFVDSIFWETSEGDTSSLPSPTFTIYDGETFLVTMTVFFTNDCSGTKTEELKLEFIDENLPDTIVLCKGDSVQINPDGDTGYHYNWTPNDFISDPTAANPTVWPNSTTVYTVEITDFSPDTCSITREVTIFVPTEIQVTAQNDTISCGLPIELCASTNLQNAQYQWAIIPDGLIGTGNCLNVLVQSDTYYEVTATDQYGCQDRDTVFVADESVKLNWQNLGAECPEIEVPLTVNNLVPDHINTYAWSVVGNGQVLPPATGPNVTIITPAAGQAGNYTVVATNQFGCSANLTQSIAGQNFIPTVQDSIDVCPGVITPLNPGADPTLNYVWSPNIGLSCTNCPNPNVTISQSMVYTVAVSGTFGLDHCEETIAVDVFSAPIINITETVDTFTCGDTILIAAQANVPLSSIQWTDASGNVLGTNIYSLNVAPVDEETYTIFVTDMFNCTATDTILVANHQLDLELTGGGVIDTCPMPSYNICVNNLDPEDLLDFVWTASNGGSILSGDTTGCPEVTTQQGLTALFEVVVTNQWGCSTTESFDITTYTFDPILRQSVIVCPNVATPINPSAENSTLTYIWSPSTWLSCNDCPNPSVNMPGGLQQFYEVTILGFNGADTCSLIQTVQVQSLPEHGLFTTPTDSVLCESTDVLLSAFYSSNFITGLAWSQTLDFSNPFSTADTVTVTPTETELYYVQTTDTLGCRDTALITINAYPVDISVDSLFNYCEEIGSLTIPVTNHYPSLPLTFVWTPLEHIALQNPDGSIVISGLEMDEVYIVDATNEYGCHEMDTADVFYYDIESTLADTIAYSKKTIFYGSGEFSQLEIDCWPGYTYEWTPTTGLNDPTICNPQAMPEDTTTYTLLITDQGGCQATRQVTVCVLNPDCDEPNLFLPNAFTPNDNDGNAMNDVLYFRSNIVSEMELAIYNRWGQRVFFSDDQSIGWDGTLNGQPLSPDVYGFYLRAKCFNGQEYFKKGNITLLR
jgi:gliding motility-associated-like protein